MDLSHRLSSNELSLWTSFITIIFGQQNLFIFQKLSPWIWNNRTHYCWSRMTKAIMLKCKFIGLNQPRKHGGIGFYNTYRDTIQSQIRNFKLLMYASNTHFIGGDVKSIIIISIYCLKLVLAMMYIFEAK